MKYFTILMLLMSPLRAMCQFNMTAYRQMPPLFDLEDYDKCLDRTEISSYCVVIGEVVPNTTSDLWNYIANFSSEVKRHYRHDYQYYGVCLNECKLLVSTLSSSQQDRLYVGNIKNTEIIEFFDDLNKNEPDTRTANEKVINTCINYNFQKHYDLQLRSYTQYCVSNKGPPSYDFLEITFMVIVGVLLFLTALSTNYDRQLRNKQAPDTKPYEFYTQSLDTQKDTVLTSFSWSRNWYSLYVPSRSDIAQDFTFLESFRFIASLMVIYCHVALFMKAIPVQNVEYIEKRFHKLGINIIVNATVITQIFFVMSSFFLCIYFQLRMAAKKPGILEWGQLVLYRYLRLAPSLAFVTLLHASILPRIQDGPFWKQITQAEYVLCRETGWRNLLFINNFTWRKSCLHHTWYLATDFQLYVVFAAILIIIARLPKTRNYILGGGVLVACLITGLVTYFLKLDAIHQDAPNSYRYMFFLNADTLFKGHAPFYMNFGGPIFGTIAALVFLKYKNHDLSQNGHRSKLNILLFGSIPIPFLLLLSGEIFYRYEFPKPSILVSVYAGLYRNVWALMCGSLLLLMSFKVGSFLYRFLSMRMFVPLGRLSYQAYLIHSLILRYVMGFVRQPVYYSVICLTTYFLTSVVLSYIAALFVYILLELPLANLMNSAIKGYGKSTKVISSIQLTYTDNKIKEETILP